MAHPHPATGSFISYKLIEQEMESFEIGSLVWFSSYCICVSCVEVFKLWMPNAVNGNEVQEFFCVPKILPHIFYANDLLRGNKFDFLI